MESLCRQSGKRVQHNGLKELEIQTWRIWDSGPGFHIQLVSFRVKSLHYFSLRSLIYKERVMISTSKDATRIIGRDVSNGDPKGKRFSTTVSWIQGMKYFSWGGSPNSSNFTIY